MTGSARNRPWRRLAAFGVALALPALTLAAAPAATAAPTPPAVQVTKPVPVRPVQPNKARIVPMPAWHAPAAVWPAAGSATVALPAAGSASAGRLPVRVSLAAPAAGVTPAIAQARRGGRDDHSGAGPADSVNAVPAGGRERGRQGRAADRRAPAGGPPGAGPGELGLLLVRVRLRRRLRRPAAAGGASSVRADDAGGCGMPWPEAAGIGQRRAHRAARRGHRVLPAPGQARRGRLRPWRGARGDARRRGRRGDYAATPLSEEGKWARAGRPARSRTRTRSGPAGSRRPGAECHARLRLAGSRRADFLDQQPGIMDRGRMGLQPRATSSGTTSRARPSRPGRRTG